MKYAVWFVRLVYAAWMIPAGLNHFLRLYPQPTGNQTVSTEVFLALLDSGLFTLVKAVELLAGIAVLLGFRLPLLLIAVLPVSFTVWYWDTELQGWWTGSAIYGWSVLSCNLFLCLAYWPSYRAMFANNAVPQLPGVTIPRLLDGLRLLLGAVLVITALRYFMPPLLGAYVPQHEWADPMAARLMAAFDVSGLGAVARFIHIAAGLMLLTNRHVPFALAALMPVNICGLFIALLIEGDPLVGTFAVAIVAVNALLMLAHLPAYRGVLEGGQVAEGEGTADGQNYNSLFANPLSQAPAKAYLGGAVVLVAAAAFYWKVVPGLNSMTGVVTLAIPAAIFLVGLVRALTRKESAPAPTIH
jgi:putative oxidoreductase